jgi:ferrous iron transport protein B
MHEFMGWAGAPDWLAGILIDGVYRALAWVVAVMLPPYRRPRLLSVVYRSIHERTLRVLRRVVVMAALAGMAIWLMGNIVLGGETVMSPVAGLLDGPGSAIGLDGVILLAFILAIPANEIVLPTILMAYMGAGAMVDVEQIQGLRSLLEAQGWTTLTAMSVLVFVALHNPCSITLLTIKKETGSWRWTAVVFGAPLVLGMVVLTPTVALARLLRAD